MKTIRILHLFPQLLSLYGEYGNVAIIKKYLEKNGYEVTVDECEFLTENIFENADFVYVGSGTEDNLLEADKRLADFTSEIKSSINSTTWLATGNAMTLFGKTIECSEKTVDAVGAFEYTTKLDYSKRFSGDVLTNCENIFNSELVGYINTSSVYNGIESCLLKLVMNEKLGNSKSDCCDGFIAEGFVATQLIGPFMVKNPSALQFIYEKITGEQLALNDDEYIVKAYNVACAELKNRLKQN